jgi:phosphatidylinositol 4-kinase type 2
MAAKSGYERLTQVDEFDEDEQAEHPLSASRSSILQKSVAILPQPTHVHRVPPSSAGTADVPSTSAHRTRGRSNSGIDIKAINARLERYAVPHYTHPVDSPRWADEITSKFQIRKKPKPRDDEEKEIGYSVFVAPGYAGEFVEFGTLDHKHPMTKPEFDAIVDSVRVAIRMGIHPRMIRQGSSGSYFVSNPTGKTVGIYKPKNEEPYGKLNPKWTKWLHRNLFPCFFGRSWYPNRFSFILTLV